MKWMQCQFSLVRYVPDPVKNEFVNIGVLLREAEPESGRDGGIVLRFTRDWARVRCVDPEADLGWLESLEGELQQQLGGRDEPPPLALGRLLDSFSTLIQLTDAKGCLAENLAAQTDRLMELYVERRKREAVSRRGGRAAIYGEMRDHFERAGVWSMMRKRIPVSDYTRAGDPLRIDCGYRPNGVVRMFQAISLEADLDAAKVLAFSMAGLREGVRRVEAAELELTAVVRPLGAWAAADRAEKRSRAEKQTTEVAVDEDRLAQYRFGVEVMERESIRVMVTGDLPRIAETAKRELQI